MEAKRPHFRHLVLLALVVFGAATCEARNLAVIVDKANTTTAVTSAELLKLFKFDKSKWPDGRSVTLVLYQVNKPEMQLALQKLYKMSPDEMKTLISSHRTSVVTVESEEALLKAVVTIPGAIGLIDVYSITNKVNVLKVDGRLPLDQGYLLHGNQ